MTLVVDASVAVRWHIDSQNTVDWRQIIAVEEDLVAPDLIVCEAANAIWRLVRTGLIGRQQGASVIESLPREFARLHPVTDLTMRAYEAASDLDHPAYDCFYLALSDVENARIVTADTKLVRRLKNTRWWDRLHPLSRVIAI